MAFWVARVLEVEPWTFQDRAASPRLCFAGPRYLAALDDDASCVADRLYHFAQQPRDAFQPPSDLVDDR